MISVEAAIDGFTVFMDGHRVLVHSVRRPCLEIGSVKEGVRHARSPGPGREPKFKSIRLKAFRIEESTPDLAVIDFEGQIRLAVRMSSGKLRITFSSCGDHINRFKLRIEAVPKESIFGCGERYGRLDLKGSLVPLWVEDRGSGRDICPIPLSANLRRNGRGRSTTTYYPHPSFVSTEKYWVHVDVTAFSRFDFRNSRFTLLETWQIPKEVVIGWGGSSAETLAGLSCHLGRPPALPPWTRKGAWLGIQGGLPGIRRKLADARTAGAKVAAVWIQDWCGHRGSRLGSQVFWNWRADADLYPDLSGTISRLKTEGIRVLGYINPFLALEGDLYTEARDKGYCVQTPEGADHVVSSGAFPFALLDLTNPRAFRWIKDIIKREMIDSGMSGWFADFGESLPDNAVLYSGASSRDIHNRWPVLWAKANHEAIEESGKSGEVMSIVRSGWSGSSAFASAFWAGTQFSDFSFPNGLASVVPAGISAGISGAGFWHFDVGGHSSKLFHSRKPECLKRWSEIAAFSPLFRTHEGCRPDANSQYWTDSAALRHFARMTEIYASLEPYHEAVAREYVDGGLPPLRHPWTHYEDDPEVRRLTYQYLYGRDILVAPVLKKGKTLQEAYLPQDRWVHFWSSRTFRGGRVSLEAPLGYPVVFYREESRFASLFDSIRRNARKL